MLVLAIKVGSLATKTIIVLNILFTVILVNTIIFTVSINGCRFFVNDYFSKCAGFILLLRKDK
jgi:hypothetical protein